jgi:HTH-type transcriptional regulator/antitoxin HipB
MLFEDMIVLIHSPQELARYYRDHRKQSELSQTMIGEEVGLRQDTVSKFENKPDNVRLETLFRLLSALDLELHLLPKGSSGVENDWAEKW